MAQCDCHVIKSEFLRGARNGYGAWRVTVELASQLLAKEKTWKKLCMKCVSRLSRK